MKAAGLETWRGWVRSAVSGGGYPKADDLLRVAALLEIADPGVAFDADVEAVKELATYEAAVETCKAAQADLLAPWGGRREKLAAAVEDAKHKYEGLSMTLRKIDEGGSVGFFECAIHNLRRSNRRAIA